MSPQDQPVVIVTGAGRGLGREHALALARAGWAVVVNDLGSAGNGAGADAAPAAQVVAEIEAMGGRALADGTDIADWQAAGALVDETVARFGRLDGLVNNAGVLRDRTLANFTEEDWDLVVRVNLKGTAAPLHHAARHWRDLAKRTGAPVRGAVVNTSSASGLYAALGQGNYAAAKAGVAALTVVAARELGRYGVRVNAIAPIATTRLTEALMSEAARARFEPALVSPLVVYLLGETAAGVTGRIFDVGGDGVVAVDTFRPAAGIRTPEGRWTTEALAEAVPALLARLPEPEMTSAESARYLQAAPLTK
jgi:NAD(P)-dependent dehydrogenase (short-subunit alcohol dehydrogenase family)